MLGIAIVAALLVGSTAMLSQPSEAEKIRDEHLSKADHYWHL